MPAAAGPLQRVPFASPLAAAHLLCGGVLVGHDDAGDAELLGNVRHGRSSVARRRFHDGHVLGQRPRGQRLLQHVLGDAVLDASRGVLVLELDVDIHV
eukprot:70257-Prorocentrum_lima.AAC.1